MGSSGDSMSLPLTNLGQGSKMRLAPPARWAPRRGQRERQWPSGLRGGSQHPATARPANSTLLFRWTQRGGQLCQFLLGLVQKTQRGGWNLAPQPPPDPTRSQLASPSHSPPNLVCGAVRNDGTGTKQGAGVGWGPGQGVEEVWGRACCCPGQARQGEQGGACRTAQHPSRVGSRLQPGRGSQGPGCLSWGRQGSGGGRETMSAPWSVRALAFARNVSL